VIEAHENINKNVMLSRLGIPIGYHDRVKAEADAARSPGCSVLFRYFENFLIVRNKEFQHRTVSQLAETTKPHFELKLDG